MGRLTPKKIIAILTSYYQHLERMYLPSEALKYPPPEGWPAFTPGIIKEIRKRKNEDVVYLMRFLPYINDRQAMEGLAEVEYSTRCIDWSETGRVSLLEQDDSTDIKQYIAEREEDRTAWMKDADDEDEEENDDGSDENENDEADGEAGEAEEKDNAAEGDQDDNASNASSSAWSYNDEDPMDYANFLQIAMGHGSFAWDIWLDTHGCSIHRDQVRASGWQSIDSVEDFYEGLKRQLDELEIVPVPALIGGDMRWLRKGGRQYEQSDKFGNVYRECGWPGEGYRKDEAMEKIKVLLQQERAEEEEAYCVETRP